MSSLQFPIVHVRTTVLPRFEDIFHVSDNRVPARDGTTDLEQELEFEIKAELRAGNHQMVAALRKRLNLCRKAIRGWDQ
jgi:predicted component of type VI protein secretion system